MKLMRTIAIDPESELGHALDEAESGGIVLLRGSERFRVIPEADDPWANYDPARLRTGLEKIDGLLTPEEAEQLVERIYRARGEGTRPSPKS
ncbi:MAG: hypothetical protein QM692_02515 [Thermomicrobiales bacterium]